MRRLVNVVLVGRGAALAEAADLLAEAAFRAGHDVKEARPDPRGGALASVRFGAEVLSPTVPRREADFALALTPADVAPARDWLREGGALLAPSLAPAAAPGTVHLALLGLLADALDLPDDCWSDALGDPDRRRAFWLGRDASRR